VTGTITRSTSAADGSELSRQPRLQIPVLLLLVAGVLALIAAATGYAVARTATPTFRTAAAISFDQPLQIAASVDSGQIDKLSRIRQKYIGVARFDVFVNAVAKEVALSPGRVRSDIIALADRTSLLLVLGASDHDALSARRVATAAANEMVAYIDREQTKAKIPDKDRVVATVVVQPKSAGRIAPTRRKEVTTGIVAGILVFLAVAGVGSLIRRPPS
jgi:hypothetical protein